MPTTCTLKPKCSMGTDYLTMDCDEVRMWFDQIACTEKALFAAEENHCPSIRSERYLTGEELCEYLHISIRTLQTLRDTRRIPFTVVGVRIFLYPETGIREILIQNYRPIDSCY